MNSATDAALRVERDGRLLKLIIDNPRQRNALHPDMYHTGAEALARASADESLGAVLLSGAGAHFCSGGNLNRLRQNRERPAETQRVSIAALHRWAVAIADCRKPVLAAVEGYAAGAGFSLALACDLLVAARDAKFVMAYVNVGLSPDGGASAWLSRSLPRQLAAEVLLGGAPLAAERLAQAGVVNRLCEPGESAAVAADWGARLARGPASAQAAIKKLLRSAYGLEQPLEEQMAAEQDSFVERLFDADCGEGIDAFLNKRRPVYHRD